MRPDHADVHDGQFTGQERDSETALDYLKARYLQPVWGRFTSPIPLMIGRKAP